MGVPGDFTLGLNEYLNQTEGLHWVGNSNELNAAYAADGYSRGSGGKLPGVRELNNFLSAFVH
jgi:pyruvate decarboxylase